MSAAWIRVSDIFFVTQDTIGLYHDVWMAAIA